MFGPARGTDQATAALLVSPSFRLTSPAAAHREGAQVAGPERLPVEVVAEEAGHAKVGVQALGARQRCLGGVGVAGLGRDRGAACGGLLLPQDLAGGAVQAGDLPAID